VGPYFESVWQALQDPGNAIYNVTYALLLLSVLMRNLSWLRIIAIGSGLAKLGYRFYTGTNPMESFWESVLVIVNVGQLALVWWDNRKRRWRPEEAQFLSTFTPPLPYSAAADLLRSGHWHEAPDGAQLTKEGEPVEALSYISSGQVRIEAGGRAVATCSVGDYLGEMTWDTGKPATGTAVAVGPVLYLSFSRASLDAAMQHRPVLRYALQTTFNRNLVDKLVRANTAMRPATA